MAHKNVKSNNDFGVVGAYPGGRTWDLLRGNSGERPRADDNIKNVPLPTLDPILGLIGGVPKLWK